MARHLAAVAAILAMSFSCTALAQQHQTHYSLSEEPRRPPPTKLVLLPVDVTVREMSAGGVVEKVPEWSEQASVALVTAAQELAQGRSDFEILPLPPLDADEQAQLDEYLAEYTVVSQTAWSYTWIAFPGWKHKREHFDYTLGHGLEFLRQKTGADGAIVIAGEDVVSTSGRKTVAVVGLLLGVAVPTGHTALKVGLVDLANGDLLWLYNDFSAFGGSLKDLSTTREVLPQAWRTYPGAVAAQAQRTGDAR